MPPFDLETASPGMRPLYENVLARIDEVGRSMVGAYRREPSTSTIAGCFKATSEFNAAAWPARRDFAVGLSAPVLPLLELLFSALLSDRKVLERLGPCGSGPRDTAKFVFDFANPADLRDFELRLTPERDAAASVLADLCVTFIYAHEIGHVMCGHAAALLSLRGEAALVEYRPRPAFTKRRIRDPGLRRYWEYQADSIAASIIPQYLDVLWRRHAGGRHAWLAQLQGRTRGERALKTHLAALTSAALAAMFIYMEGGRLERRVLSYHPHPITRSLYVKDRILAVSADMMQIDPRAAGKLVYEYLEPFLFRLERLGLGSVRKWDPAILGEMEAEAERLAQGGPHREVARAWSWLPVDGWA